MKTPSKGQPGKRRNPRDDRGPRREDSRPFRGGGSPRGEDRRGPRGAAGGDGRPPRRGRPEKPSIQIKGELVYGRNAVRESLRAERRQPTRLFVAEGVRDDERFEEMSTLGREHEVLVERVPRMLLDDLTRGGNHQGVALETSAYPYVDLEDVIEREGTILVMDHLNDPQNFGTLMRAADAFDIAGIVLPQNRSVSVTPAVVNASAGAIEHVQVALTPNLARALDKIEASGRWIIGLDEDEEPNSIIDADIPTPVALVLGSEGTGLSPIVRKRCQMVVSIPMNGNVDSLNAATAGSIVLYELHRRAHMKSPTHSDFDGEE